MSDAKTVYRTTVWAQKQKAFFDSVILKKISNGMKRAQKYKNDWQAVNINTFVEKFVPNPIITVDLGKIYFTSQDGKLAVIADLGGTYCRLADLTKGKKPFYLDINGNDPSNYTDSRGKQHGRSKDDKMKITHFRIKKWHEMEKQLPAVIYDFGKK